MRPADIYALPTQEAEAWHDSYGTLAEFFGDESLDYELDRQAGKQAGADELSFERKLHLYVDHRKTVTYTAVTFRGAPIGLLLHGEENGGCRRVVTDADGFRAARAYLEAFHSRDESMRADCAAADAEIEGLDRHGGFTAVTHGGETFLAKDSHLDSDGGLLFARRAFDEAYQRTVMPVIRDLGREAMRGPDAGRVRELVVEAVMQAIPDGVNATTLFDEIPAVEGVHRYQSWSPVLVEGGERTFTVGLNRYEGDGQWSTRGVDVEPVGPASLYGEIAREPSAPAP